MTNDQREFDVIVWGASGFTGRLVAEYLAQQYGPGGDKASAAPNAILRGSTHTRLAPQDEAGEEKVGLAVGLVSNIEAGSSFPHLWGKCRV